MITIILLILAGISKAFMDLSSEDKFKSNKLNKSKTSWNKYKKFYEIGYVEGYYPLSKSPWYYFKLYTPKYYEIFPYSSTFLVFLTDWWHLFQFIYYKFLILAIVFYISWLNIWWMDGLLIACFILVPFEISYNIIKRSKLCN